jgi:hypothetical protein
MPKNMDSPIELIAFVLIILVILIGYVAAQSAEQALDDPNDKERVYLDQLPALSLLSGVGAFHVRIFRQSGYLHAQYDAPSASSALSQAIATFRRAKIETIRISRNAPDELHFNRLFHSHRGSAEGKKVGSVEITRVA